MLLRLLYVLLVFSPLYVENGAAEHSVRTLAGHPSNVNSGSSRTLVFDTDTEFGEPPQHGRSKRDAPQPVIKNATIKSTVNHLNDTHKQMMVHWVGEGSSVIICLARDPARIPGENPSAVFISYDYGEKYTNKTDLFKLPNGSYAVLEKFYNHPKYNTHFVFTDVKNKFIFTTSNHGRDIQRIQLNFTPSEVVFHELLPSIFFVHDKNDNDKKVWITQNFGQTFSVIQQPVKSVIWLEDNNGTNQIVVQRYEPKGTYAIAYLSNFQSSKATVFDTNVQDFYVKENYLFLTKRDGVKGSLSLYISYKLGTKIPCIFDTTLEANSYYIVDVSNNRALVAISHSDTLSHLYVSENLSGYDGKVRFTLSLESVFHYFPNTTWNKSWLQHVSDEAFADVYKVEGINGIFIASQLVGTPLNHNVQPQHLVSMISFDHGGSWRKIAAPRVDNEGQPLSCEIENNCSLHLSQKFAHYYPDIRAVSILSSKSAPGLIIANGVVGNSLKGHYGVFVSSDAGVTWHHALKDLYFFNMGDHGGILTAITYFYGNGNNKTHMLYYSTDEGEKWSQAQFYNGDIRLYGLMTEPGENTTVFTIFGSAPVKHQWIIIKVDLKSVFSYNCTKDDYKTWMPGQDENRSYIPCVMGQQLTYERRMPHSNCYNGLDYDRPISTRPCSCDAIDYECDYGFVRTGNPYYCIRNKSMNFDPYEIPKTCKPGQFYNRTKGYRKISGDSCVDGFEKHYLPDKIPCPFQEVQQFLLFAQRERICRYDLKKKELQELPIANLRNVITVDFDMHTNCVYFADIVTDTIGRQCLSNGSAQEILVSSDLASVEGLALDWISHTLYFVDGTRAKIELIRTDINHFGRMRRTVLNSTVLTKPRGIALHPTSGYMFWTDWAADAPSINRANLDGSNVKVLFRKPDVGWPNGITVDHIAERIYWVDGKLDYISSSDLHGDRINRIISKENYVSHPFAIAVFKDEMYWDDWKNNAIYAADKDHGVAVEVLLKFLPGLMDLKVYAHSLQEGTNACNNSNLCPYICVGAPKGGHSCLCPDGMEPRNGKCYCPGGVEILPNMTCPQIDKSCSPQHFTCKSGVCIPNGWKCDGDNDCGDNSDEQHCGSTCQNNYFTCGDGKCIPQYWRCDFERDCYDGSDEVNCTRQNCTNDQFQCNNGRCISKRWKCDRENDCADFSDEIDCNPLEPRECKSFEFKCASGAVSCIPTTWKCDGERDCRDYSDENDCEKNVCPDTLFSCGPPSNRCIYTSWRCDGDYDCPNNADEMNCTTSAPVKPPTETPPNTFNQVNGSCHDWMFTCRNKMCIPEWWTCDRADDCGDGSDELDCAALPKHRGDDNNRGSLVCGPNQFRCMSNECIAQSWVCDGSKDCVNGDDELDCNASSRCTNMEFKCRMDGSCIALKDVCNQVRDCPDGSDESSCDHNLPGGPATPSCYLGYFPCDVNSCHPLASRCDGKIDCLDGFDERNCSTDSRIYQVLQMGVDEKHSNQSSLYLYWWISAPRTELEFMPAISKVGANEWRNESWMNLSETEHLFVGLNASTEYNMTVYVRVKGSSNVFPPAKYIVYTTSEGIPTEPWNINAEQRNGSHILLSWNPPLYPNGEIQYYEICWYPPKPPIQLKLSDNTTAHLLTADFQPDQTYSFYVIAHNRLYESKRSEVKSIKFDGDTDVGVIRNLTVTAANNYSISLSWNYAKRADGFKVDVKVEGLYPNLPPRFTNVNSITISDLAPGAKYIFSVSAFKKTYSSPESIIIASTTGRPLPTIEHLDSKVFKDVGTSVKLSWDMQKFNKKVSWVYGVYYGLHRKELMEQSRMNTSDSSVTISKLQACETYMFSIGVVQPHGIGPLSRPVNVTTYMNEKAPPKRLNVVADKSNPLTINVTWAPSCATSGDIRSYHIKVYERTQDKTIHVTKPNCTELAHKFNIMYGAIYDIQVAADVIGAEFSQNVTYYAPPLLPPYDVHVMPKANGTYLVYWGKRDVPQIVGNYTYEVLVSEGPILNEKTAQRFEAQKSPFVYTNTSSDVYTFAVHIKTQNGYNSLLSEALSSRIFPETSANDGVISTTSLTAILVPVLLIIVVLSVTVGILIIRHRRLQNSFSRFANSHYDTRSGAATFDDNGLEEDDSPHIRGFSDDEPLVIA